MYEHREGILLREAGFSGTAITYLCDLKLKRLAIRGAQ